MDMNPKVKEHRQRIADAFVASLEKDGLEWKRGWDSMTGIPYNAQTGKQYRGINQVYLYLITQEKAYTDPRWATFKQIKANGWKLQKGAKGEKIEYWVPFNTELKKYMSWEDYNANRKSLEAAGTTIQFFPQYYTVFNGQFIDGLAPLPMVDLFDGKNVPSLDDAVMRASASMGVEILNDGGDRAYYRPSEDKIHLPERPEAFISEYEYNTTALHELTHATGAPHRLSRNIANVFGSEPYAYEELVAEIGAAFMGGILPLSQSQYHIENHAAYVSSWIQGIKNQPDILIQAIRDAERASDYLEYHAGLVPVKEVQKAAQSSFEVPDSLIRNVNPVMERRDGYSAADTAQKLINEKRNMANEYIIETYGERAISSQIDALIAGRPQEGLNEFQSWLKSAEGKQAFRFTDQMRIYGYHFYHEDEDFFLHWKHEETGKSIRVDGFEGVKDFLDELMTKDLALKASEVLLKERGNGRETGLPVAVEYYFDGYGEKTLPAFEGWLKSEEGQRALLFAKQMHEAGFRYQGIEFGMMRWLDPDGTTKEFDSWKSIGEYIDTDSTKSRDLQDTLEYMANEYVMVNYGDRPSLNIVQGMVLAYEKSARDEGMDLGTETFRVWLNSPDGGKMSYETMDRMAGNQYELEKVEETEDPSLGRLEFFTMDSVGQPVYHETSDKAVEEFLSQGQEERFCTLGFHFPEVESRRFLLFSSTPQGISAVDNLNVLAAQQPEVGDVARRINNYITEGSIEFYGVKVWRDKEKPELKNIDGHSFQQILDKEKQPDFSNCAFRGITFENLDISDMSFSGNRFENCNFNETDLRNSCFEGAYMSDCSFYKTNLKHVQMKDATVLSSRFFDCNLTKADLSNSTLRQCILHGNTVLEQNIFSNCYLNNVKFYSVENRGGHQDVNTARLSLPGATTKEFEEYKQTVNAILQKEGESIPQKVLSPELRSKLQMMESQGVVFTLNGKGAIRIPKEAEKYLSKEEVDTVTDYIKESSKEKGLDRKEQQKSAEPEPD